MKKTELIYDLYCFNYTKAAKIKTAHLVMQAIDICSTANFTVLIESIFMRLSHLQINSVFYIIE